MLYNYLTINGVFENLFEVRRLFFADLSHGRMDNPGFSAKYCTYTFMEYHSNDILWFLSTKEILISSQLIWRVLVLKRH